jgi:LuxR family maltose regulon positive regulatory protein
VTHYPQQVDPEVGLTAQSILQAPQLPATEVLMTTLINALTKTATKFFIVLDVYHLIDTQPIQDALTF